MPDRSQLEVIKPAVRAASAYRLEHRDADVKLDQNENPYELPDELKRDVVHRVLESPWGRYPELVPEGIIEALSRFTGWPKAGILVGNGSNELINAALTVTLHPASRVAIAQPTFTLYKLMSTTLGARVDEIYLNEQDMSFDVDSLVRAAREADVLVLCSPNNPTGSLLDPSDTARILENARGLVILDEAYHEFSGQNAVSLLERFDNLLLLRTFSKAMSLAGLRFGYLLTRPEIAAEINKAKLPYSVNIFTLAAAQAVLERIEVLDGAVRSLIEERERIFGELDGRPGIQVFPSRANFILIKTPHPAGLVFDALYAEGVLVRDVSRYPLLDRALRVSIGKPDENTRFLSTLDRVLETLA